VCSQGRAINDTIAALGDGADHERNKQARNAVRTPYSRQSRDCKGALDCSRRPASAP